MASTNKTTNLNLTQFVASDKPAWLTDYNNDMRAIDDAVGAVETAQAELSQQVSAQGESLDGLEARIDSKLLNKAAVSDFDYTTGKISTFAAGVSSGNVEWAYNERLKTISIYGEVTFSSLAAGMRGIFNLEQTDIPVPVKEIIFQGTAYASSKSVAGIGICSNYFRVNGDVIISPYASTSTWNYCRIDIFKKLPEEY